MEVLMTSHLCHAIMVIIIKEEISLEEILGRSNGFGSKKWRPFSQRRSRKKLVE
jgi:dephospho-CoA kinase